MAPVIAMHWAGTGRSVPLGRYKSWFNSVDLKCAEDNFLDYVDERANKNLRRAQFRQALLNRDAIFR